MKLKTKIIFLTFLINSLVFSNDNVSKYNSELIVGGEGVRERVDYTLYADKDNPLGSGEIVNKAENGKKNAKHAVFAEKGAEVHNIGKILSYNESIESHLGGLLIMGIVNPLKRTDSLVVLRGIQGELSGTGGRPNVYTVFKNDGLVKMGGLYHDIRVGNIAGLIPTSLYYADYKKNTVNARYADIENKGTITNEMDSVTYLKALDVGILNGFFINYEKNAVLLDNGTIKNSGIIEYNRDEKFVLTNGVAVDLLQIGVEYNRKTAGINASNAVVENSGKVFVGGDIVTEVDYSGIGVSALGADLKGHHEKYGITLEKGTLINTGTIEVERDFKKALDENNNILDLYLIYQNLVKLGLLSFTELSETSIGAHINNGTFYNNNGTISVGVNDSKKFGTQIRSAAGIAVSGENGAKIYFNADPKTNEAIDTGKSTINLEGKKVYAVWLESGSEAVFNGTTEINFIEPGGLDDEDKKDYLTNRNKDIFYKDNTSKITVNGKITANGDFNIQNLGLGATIVKKPIMENGKVVGYEVDTKPAVITSTGKINLLGNVKLDSERFIGMSEKEMEKYLNHKYIEADGGIEGDGNIVSSSFLFEIETDKTDNSITLTNVDRKNFTSIVANKELGNILENSYENMSEKEKDFYKYIASGSSSYEFSKKLDEAAGTDNITTLQIQVMDITKDLNRQYRGFAKNNEAEGVVFSYLNSKSEAGSEGKYQGFERKSSGIMTAYNKNISDKLRAGAGFSYMTSDIDYTSNSSNKIETWNARGYFDYGFKNINLLTDLSFSYNKSENKRQISGTLNEGTADIYTLGLNNSLYGNYKINEKFSFSPSINLDFTYYYQDDYQEGENTLAVEAEKTYGMYMTLGAGAEFKYDLFSFGKNKFSLVGGLEYSYDVLSENEDMEIELTAFKDGKFSEEIRKTDKEFLIYDLGISYEYGETYSVDIKYSKELINDVENEKIGLDFSYKF